MLRQPTLGGSADVVNGAWEKVWYQQQLESSCVGLVQKRP